MLIHSVIADRTRQLRVAGLVLMLAAGSVRADSVITIRVSIKVILNPVTGSPPQGVVPALIEALVVPEMNFHFRTFQRGYQFELVDPVTLVGGAGDPGGPSQWFDAPQTQCFLLLDAALADPVAYAWNPTTLNVYINNTAGGQGIACYSPDPAIDDAIFILSRDASTKTSTYLQEFGHYFGLCHTQGCGCNNCDPQQTGECHTVPGDDGISDTVEDLQCWGLDEIANYNFGAIFASLTPAQQEQCNNVWFNIMSYHPLTNRLTEQQLDRWTDGANVRELVLDGRMHFVDPNGSASGDGSSGNPFDTVAAGVAAANPGGGDIVLLRPGTFNEQITISKPLTLRVTRAGGALIGTAFAP